MKKIIFILAALISFILLKPADIYPQNETHEGFYMNVLTGGGYSQSVARKLSSDEPVFTGMAGLFRFRAGYAPVEDIIFFGAYGITKVYFADTEGDSLTLPVKDLALSYHDYGIGVAIYIPLNICIAGEMSKSRLLWYADDDKYYSDNGASFTFSLGKEWWIAEDWGMGAALIARVGSMTLGKEIAGHDYRDKVLAHSFIGLALSVTYN